MVEAIHHQAQNIYWRSLCLLLKDFVKVSVFCITFRKSMYVIAERRWSSTSFHLPQEYPHRAIGHSSMRILYFSPVLEITMPTPGVTAESRCALRLRYVDLVVTIEVAVEMCCCCVTFHCVHLTNRSAASVCE